MDAQETRRLHELAAKAFGLHNYRYCEAWKCMAAWIHTDGGWFDCRSAWQPLADDGDSRRLEVALNIHCRQYRFPVRIRGCWCQEGFVEAVRKDIEEREPINGNPCAATRLAVLRVAAAIGEAMQKGTE